MKTIEKHSASQCVSWNNTSMAQTIYKRQGVGQRWGEKHYCQMKLSKINFSEIF